MTPYLAKGSHHARNSAVAIALRTSSGASTKLKSGVPSSHVIVSSRVVVSASIATGTLTHPTS